MPGSGLGQACPGSASPLESAANMTLGCFTGTLVLDEDDMMQKHTLLSLIKGRMVKYVDLFLFGGYRSG